MRLWNLFILALALAMPALAEIEEFAVKPLTQEQLSQRSLVQGEKPTFKTKTFEKEKVFYTGLKKHGLRAEGDVEHKFELKAEPFKKELDLRTVATLQEIFDQGSCGSCVYNAVDACWNDTMRLRGLVLEPLSRQYLMSCGSRDSMCNGSWFEIVAEDLVKMGGLPFEKEYPYTASNASCKGKNLTLQGKVVSKKLIATTDKSIIGALNEYYPVATTIGAGGSFMNYSSGVFNGCSNIGTNHQMVIEGYRCVGSSVDAQGNCIFESNNNVKAGNLEYLVRNSWSTGWGDEGWIWMKARDSRGNRCNNLAEEVGIVEVGMDPTPPTPPNPPTPPTPPTPPLPPTPDQPVWHYLLMGLIGVVMFFVGWLVKKK